MPNPTVKILVPKMVVVDDALGKEVLTAVGQMMTKAVEKGLLSETLAQQVIDGLSLRKSRDFPMVEFLSRVVDSCPKIHSGGSKMAALAYRVINAFADAAPGDLIEVSREAQELISAYLDAPDYERQDAQGKTEVIKGWPPAINQYLARMTWPYQDAWAHPLDDDAVAALKATAPTPKG
jgi:hypothetical protein